jgi:hypothetical protein
LIHHVYSLSGCDAYSAAGSTDEDSAGSLRRHLGRERPSAAPWGEVRRHNARVAHAPASAIDMSALPVRAAKNAARHVGAVVCNAMNPGLRLSEHD